MNLNGFIPKTKSAKEKAEEALKIIFLNLGISEKDAQEYSHNGIKFIEDYCK